MQGELRPPPQLPWTPAPEAAGLSYVRVTSHGEDFQERWLTQGTILQGERDDAEQVDIGVVDSELHKHGSGQGVQPAVVKEILENPVEEECLGVFFLGRLPAQEPLHKAGAYCLNLLLCSASRPHTQLLGTSTTC